MEISIVKSSIKSETSDAVIIGMFQKEFEVFESNLIVNKLIDGYLAKLFDRGEITGKQSEITLIHTPDSFYKNSWSTVGNNGDPITILRNGQPQNTRDRGWVPITEDINEDLSSIYLTSYQKLGNFNIASDNYGSYPTPPEKTNS